MERPISEMSAKEFTEWLRAAVLEGALPPPSEEHLNWLGEVLQRLIPEPPSDA